MDKLAVDLLWLRIGGVGGAEFYVRNLLDGFAELDEPFKMVLVCSTDNADSFKHYADDPRFEILTAPIANANISKRIIWQNLHMNSFMRKNGLKYCFSPVYDRPFLNGGIKWYTVVHDIQAYYYPEYHPLHEVVYSKMAWRSDKKGSVLNFTTTEYVKSDIIKAYRFNPDAIKVINIPVIVDEEAASDDEISAFRKKYSIEGEYFYTISQLIPHKNFPTLVKLMAEIRKNHPELPQKLYLSGISGNGTAEFERLVKEEGLEDTIIRTGFVSNEDKFMFYRNCKYFLFPSYFEGFGIPPVEAMMCGATVVTTNKTSIPEVTQGKANYVDDPLNVDEWINAIKGAVNRDDELDSERYEKKFIAKQFYDVFFGSGLKQ